MDEVCEVCGKKLTKWNRAWGTQKCSSCAKGRSPKVKQQKAYEVLERAPFQNAEEIKVCRLLPTLLKACVLLLLVNVIANIGHIMAQVTLNTGFFYVELFAFVIGIWGGGKALFGNANLLEIRRWKCCWHADILGYVLGHILWLFVAAISRVSATVSDSQLTSAEGFLLFLGAIVLPPLVGIFLGVANVRRAEKKNIAYTVRIFEEWSKSKMSEGPEA